MLGLLAAAAGLAQPVTVGLLITSVQKGSLIWAYVWALIALILIATLITGLQAYVLQRAGENIVLSARNKLVFHMLRLPIGEFDRRRNGDLVSRVGTDTTLLRSVLTTGLVSLATSVLTFVGALIAMFVVDPVLVALTACIALAAILASVTLSRKIRAISASAQESVGALASGLDRALGAIRTIRAANATERETKELNARARQAWRHGLAVARIQAFIIPIGGLTSQVAVLVVLGVGGLRVASGAMSVASLVSFILFLFVMVSPLGQILGAIGSISQGLGAVSRLNEILDLEVEDANDIEVATTPASGLAPWANRSLSISFDDVTFAYPATTGSDTSETGPAGALRNLHFEIPNGKRTAFVGPSGAGKSTMLALIERFYDPTSGAILVDGRDLRELDRRWWRSHIGYVEQGAPILAGTLRENLTISAPSASDIDCIDVLMKVNLTGVLERSTDGLDAEVGENGVLLSGGEGQRLAIARALLASPPILLLDESTSSLDSMNEQLLREALEAVSYNRTMVVIAHRLSTVVDSDQIIVVDGGEVVGSGTHRELMESNGLYRDLATRQFIS